MRRVSAHCRAGMRPAASASPKAARPRASGAMDAPDDPPSMLGDTGQLTSAKSAPDSARCHARLPRQPCQCSASPAAQLSVGRRRRRGAVACERPVTPEESCTSESAARIFGTSARERASPLRAPLAFALSSAAAWLRAALRGQAPPPRASQPREALIRPSAQPSEAGQGGCHHWIFGRSLGAPWTSSDRCSMRSAHTAAFTDRIGMRSIFSCRTTRPSAAR